MLVLHAKKSWNIPHELPSSVGTMGEPARQEGGDNVELEATSSVAQFMATGISPFEDRRDFGSKSAPNSPRFGSEDYPVNNNLTKIKKLEKGTRKRKKGFPDYVSFSKSTSKSLSWSTQSINDMESEKKKDSLERKNATNKDSTEATELKRKLAELSFYGLPRLSREIRQFWEIGEETSIRLEKSWMDIVRGHENMSRKYSHQQEAVWELVDTELKYMKKLRIITDLVICTLMHLRDCKFLTEIDPAYLFTNIPNIIQAHRRFWQEVISPELERVRKSRQPLDPMSFYEGFCTFPERFNIYVAYCLEVKKKMEYVREQYKENELFRVFVNWIEKHKLSRRLRLGDMLMRPHQRITKYSLLLKAILKRTEDPVMREGLNGMATSVEQFLQQINTQMQREEDYDHLHATMDRIGAYDVLEPGSEEIDKYVKNFSTLNLTGPIQGVSDHNIRKLLKEGPLKMKEGKEGKAEVYGFLFTDTFLITKMHRKTELAKVIRSPLMLDKIVCRTLKEPNTFLIIYLNEFGCVAQALSFQCASADVCKEWTDKFRRAQESLKMLKAEEVVQRQEQERHAHFLPSDSRTDLLTLDSKRSSVWSDNTMQDTQSQSEFTIVIPRLVITEDEENTEKSATTADTSSSRMADPGSSADEHSEISDPGYGTLLHNTKPPNLSEVQVTPPGGQVPLRGLRKHLSRPGEDPQVTLSSSDLRQRHSSEPFNQVETSTLYSLGSAVANKDLRWSMSQLFQSEDPPRPGHPLKVPETNPGPFAKFNVSVSHPPQRVPGATSGSESEDERSNSRLIVRPQTKVQRGPSFVVETLQRARHRERVWRFSVADSVNLNSDSQSELSDVEEPEAKPGSVQAESNQDGQEHGIPMEDIVSKLSLEGQDENGHAGTGEIQLTGDPSNPSELVQTRISVNIEHSIVPQADLDTSPNGTIFSFERPDSQDFEDILCAEQVSTDAEDDVEPPTPRPLSPEGFQENSALYDSSATIMPALLTKDIFMEILRDANHQRRRLTKAELQRIRSIKINTTTTVSEV